MEAKLSAYGIILVFISLLFIHLDKSINEFNNKPKPDVTHNKAFIKWIKDKNYLKIKSILGNIFIFISFYITLPDTLNIVNQSIFNLWDFDEIDTTYCLVSASIMTMFIILVVRILNLINK